jgi:hypothetical protein
MVTVRKRGSFGKREGEHFSPSSGIFQSTGLSFRLIRQRIRAGDKRYAELNSSKHRCVLVVSGGMRKMVRPFLVSGLFAWELLDQYLSPCSLRILEKLSLLLSLEGMTGLLLVLISGVVCTARYHCSMRG